MPQAREEAIGRAQQPVRRRLAGYTVFKDGREYVGAVGELRDSNIRKIGTAIITSRWKTPKSYVSSHMFQIEVTTPYGVYTGRGAGHGMIWNGRRMATSRRRTPEMSGPSFDPRETHRFSR